MVAELEISNKTLPTTLAEFRDYHAGATIIVCGCGSSLLTLKNPERFLTIGVNDVGRLFQPDYLVVLNTRSQFTRDRFQHIESSRARALFTHVNLAIPHPHIVKILLGKRGGTNLENANALPYTRNSPYVAAMLALHMGAKTIGLIGVDFIDHHFFAKTGRHSLTREVPQIDTEYRRLHAACEQRGVELVNLSQASRLTSLPKVPLENFVARKSAGRTLKIVSYATSPIAGVPVILGNAIGQKTAHSCTTVWASNSYGNGVVFPADVEYSRRPAEANELLSTADVVVVHNGKVSPQHRRLLQEKAVLTLAHNYKWNVNSEFVDRQLPGLVVAQYQATLPEFKGWKAVPNPIPWWDPSHQPGKKGDAITIAYTPFGRHERFPLGHKLYWHSKGYRTTRAILERLARKHPIQLEIIGRQHVSHAESQAMKRRAHIVIDECVTGSYHRNSLEGLAAGAVVVNGVGLRPEIVSVLTACAGTQEIPFVRASLDSLEQVLEELIEQGAAALAERGRSGRAWIERHWDFEAHWSQFWEPAVAQALDRARPQISPTAPGASTPALAPKAAAEAPLSRGAIANSAVDVVAPAAAGAVSFVAFGSSSFPKEADIVLATHGEKPRAFNAAFPFAKRDLVFFIDDGLLLTDEFLARAVEELESRSLHVLTPWTSITNGPNTRSSRRGDRGGVVLARKSYLENFGGYFEDLSPAAADEAFFAKAKLLARAAITWRGDQHLDQTGPAPPGVQESDLKKLHEIRTLHSRQQFLLRYPPPATFTAPWHGVRRIFVEQEAAEVGRALVELYGGAVLIVGRDESPHATLRRQGEGAPRDQALEFAASLEASREALKLNLGCFDRPAAGFLNVDGEVDLTARWPWSDGEASVIRAHDVIEHLPDKIHTMNELWRVLRERGKADITVPTTEGSGAYQDPTHVSFWNRRSFLYYEEGSAYRERFAERYGIRAKFRVFSEETKRTPDGPLLHIVLEAVK